MVWIRKSAIAVEAEARKKGMTITECWCKRKVLEVSWIEVRCGLTRSCGQSQCKKE